MPSTFEREGISFRYPESWRLEPEETDGGWTVLLQSPGTAFLMLTFDDNMPATEEIAGAALAALCEEYPTLEAEERADTLAGQMAVGHDLTFLSLDLTHTCWTRSFQSETGTILVLCQTSDLELAEYGAVLEVVCASLRVEE